MGSEVSFSKSEVVVVVVITKVRRVVGATGGT
jgi:hypothetical protein